MFFTNPTPTPYDLCWQMFGIPVRVHPTFWLFAAIFGWSTVQYGIGILLLWIACTFISILVHELGHVFVARIFGEPSHIVLYAFGGLAMGNYQNTARWQRVLILCGGPGAGFLLYGAICLLYSQLDLSVLEPVRQRFVFYLFEFLLFMNLLWNLLNLLPIQPLDGGQIMRELCLTVSRRRGLQFSLGLSFLCAGLIAMYSGIRMARPEIWYPPFRPNFILIMFALLTMQSYAMMQQAAEQQRHWDFDDHRRD